MFVDEETASSGGDGERDFLAENENFVIERGSGRQITRGEGRQVAVPVREGYSFGNSRARVAKKKSLTY